MRPELLPDFEEPIMSRPASRSADDVESRNDRRPLDVGRSASAIEQRTKFLKMHTVAMALAKPDNSSQCTHNKPIKDEK